MMDSLSSRCDSNSRFERVLTSNAFVGFLLYDKQGPKISKKGATMLQSYYDIDNLQALIHFSQLPIRQMLVRLPTQELENVRKSDFLKLILYGKYLDSFCLITRAGTIDFDEFDPSMFQLYQ
jgi:hypothetical protein